MSFCIIYFDLRMDRNPEIIRIKKLTTELTTDASQPVTLSNFQLKLDSDEKYFNN